MANGLTMDELVKMADEAGIRKSGFSRDIFFNAWLYCCVIRNLVHVFCGSGEGYDWGETEYIVDHRRDFELSQNVCLVKRDPSELLLFLRDHESFMPPELRKTFRFCAGCLDFDQDGFLILPDGILPLSNLEWLDSGMETDLNDEISDKGVLWRTKLALDGELRKRFAK